MSKSEPVEWIDWMNTKVLQKAVLVDEADNILSIKRSDYKPGGRPGKWDLPGGSMVLADLTVSEPHLKAIKREIKEETGLDVEKIEPIWIGSGKKLTQTAGEVLIYAIGFRCKVRGIKPEVRLSNEHTDSKWGTKEEILNLDFGDDGGMHPNIIQQA